MNLPYVLQYLITVLPMKSFSSNCSKTGGDPKTDDFFFLFDWNGLKCRLATNIARRER